MIKDMSVQFYIDNPDIEWFKTCSKCLIVKSIEDFCTRGSACRMCRGPNKKKKACSIKNCIICKKDFKGRGRIICGSIECLKQRKLECTKEYYIKNKQETIIRVGKRRKRTKYTSEQYDHVLWCRKQTCSYCMIPGNKGTHDHVIPLFKGGTNDINNMVPCCSKCNDSKGTKLLSEWKNRWYKQGD